MQSVKWAWSSSEVCKWDGLFQMGSVCMRVKRTDVPVFPSNARIVQPLQRDGIFTQRDGDYSRAGGKQSSVERVALSQTSWVANGEGAAPAAPVEIQREAGFHLPLPPLAITLSHLVPWTITALMDW